MAAPRLAVAIATNVSARRCSRPAQVEAAFFAVERTRYGRLMKAPRPVAATRQTWKCCTGFRSGVRGRGARRERSLRRPRRALRSQRPHLLGRFVARDAERLTVVELVAAALARGPDVVRVPADHQQTPAPPAALARAAPTSTRLIADVPTASVARRCSTSRAHCCRGTETSPALADDDVAHAAAVSEADRGSSALRPSAVGRSSRTSRSPSVLRASARRNSLQG